MDVVVLVMAAAATAVICQDAVTDIHQTQVGQLRPGSRSSSITSKPFAHFSHQSEHFEHYCCRCQADRGQVPRERASLLIHYQSRRTSDFAG